MCAFKSIKSRPTLPFGIMKFTREQIATENIYISLLFESKIKAICYKKNHVTQFNIIKCLKFWIFEI